MREIYKSILLPVDNSIDEDVVMQAACNLAPPGQFFIHLVYVIKPGFFSWLLDHNRPTSTILEIGPSRFVKAMLRLSELKKKIEQRRREAIVKIHICRGSNANLAVAWFANRLNIQLILLAGKKTKNTLFTCKRLSPAIIADATDCEVLFTTDEIP